MEDWYSLSMISSPSSTVLKKPVLHMNDMNRDNCTYKRGAEQLGAHDAWNGAQGVWIQFQVGRRPTFLAAV